jgi:hypothetical protein
VSLRALLCLMLLCGCSRGLSARQFQLEYRREGKVPAEAGTCPGFSRVSVRDARPNPRLLGDRSRDVDPKLFPVTTTTNVAQWVRTGLEAQLKAAGYPFAEPTLPAIVATLQVADLHERVAGQGTFTARVMLDVQLADFAGRPCFQGTFEAEGKNTGADGRGENYTQTFNRALDAVAVSLLDHPQFREQACGRCSAAR